MILAWRKVYGMIIGRWQNQVLRNRLLRSLQVFSLTLLVMTFYQITKTLFAKNITVWQSQAVTILFTGIVAGIAAYLVLGRQEELLAQVAHERALLETVTQNVGAGLWFPCAVDFRVTGKTAVFFRLDTSFRATFTNLRRFNVETESDVRREPDAGSNP